jgi:signal transduction histidine kinase
MKTTTPRLRWTPATVSWLSFVIMGLVVAGIGLTGTAHVVGYLHGRLLAHGIEHDREVAEHLRTMVEHGLAGTAAPDMEMLREVFATFGVFGYRLFLVDRSRGLLVADTGNSKSLPRRLASTWLAATAPLYGTMGPTPLGQGAATSLGENGHPLLLWLEDLGDTAPAPGRWLLGVASDEKTVTQFLGDLHWHLDGVMLLTYLLIALLGYFAVRSVGRLYERKLEAQVRDRTLALKTAHEEILRKTRLATIGQTASVLAHEMRNPLASIKLALSGLRGDGHIPQRAHRRVDLVLGEVDRLDGLLSETLDYVRPIRLSPEPILLQDLLDRVLGAQRPLLTEHGFSVRQEPCGDCPGIRLDQDKMYQVLLNLLKNAVEASPAGGEIHIRQYRHGAQLVLDIGNGGQPMDGETLARAFEPFFTTKPRGSGLGLGLVKRVVEEHGGSVALASDADTGTRVTLRLPLPGD